jgi:hypothetical protein
MVSPIIAGTHSWERVIHVRPDSSDKSNLRFEVAVVAARPFTTKATRVHEGNLENRNRSLLIRGTLVDTWGEAWRFEDFAGLRFGLPFLWLRKGSSIILGALSGPRSAKT